MLFSVLLIHSMFFILLQDVDDWVGVIQDSIAVASTLKLTESNNAVANNNAKSVQKGILELKNKKYFCSIRDGCLYWMEHETGSNSVV
jgi:hypothetical protein